MNSVFASAVWLFGYAFLSNVALAVLPHEPVVIWYGARHGVWPTALVATAGTVATALVDHRLFVPLIARAATRRTGTGTACRAPTTPPWPGAGFPRPPLTGITLP